jgi:hypothetical protein
MDALLHLFLTSAIDEVRDQPHASAALRRGPHRTGGCAGTRAGLEVLEYRRILLPLPGFKPRNVQPGAQLLY